MLDGQAKGVLLAVQAARQSYSRSAVWRCPAAVCSWRGKGAGGGGVGTEPAWHSGMQQCDARSSCVGGTAIMHSNGHRYCPYCGIVTGTVIPTIVMQLRAQLDTHADLPTCGDA